VIATMTRKVPAVYEQGVLKPLEPLALPEGQHVTVTIDEPPVAESPEDALQAWQQVYAGLSDEEIAEIEAIALDRSNFMRPERESAD
jgi:predicted DNA-binding antitoxin AbrB/MazE fold protein